MEQKLQNGNSFVFTFCEDHDYWSYYFQMQNEQNNCGESGEIF